MGEPYLKNFGNNLRHLRQNKSWSQEELAYHADLDRTYISMLERGIRNPTLGAMRSLAQALEIDLQFLVEESVPMIPAASARPKIQGPLKGIKLPLYGTSISCGRPLTADDTIEKELSLDEFFVKRPDLTFFAKASGDSMAPSIQDGDFLIIERGGRPKNGEVVMVRLDGEFSIKRFQKNDDRTSFQSDNPRYSHLSTQDFSEVILCGVVKAVIRASL